MNEEQLRGEVKLLRQECDRLRMERDHARKKREEVVLAEENESSTRLKLLSESLSREIKERFLASLKSTLWIATILIGIATAGGLWKLSDIVTARIDTKIKEKEQDVAHIRKQIINSVVDFERLAKKSLDEIETLKAQVAQESEQATGEIRKAKARILAFKFSSDDGKITLAATAPQGSGALTWFGPVTGTTVAVAGSQADEFGYDDPSGPGGAFSIRFQRALQDVKTDTNQDGQISVSEAVASTEDKLRQSNFHQIPTIAGKASEIALFSATSAPQKFEKYKVVHAVVVGINKYQGGSSMALQGAVNDAERFINLLRHSDRRLFGSSNINSLLDEKATAKSIMSAIDALRGKVSKDDLVVFYFSGHVSSIGKGDNVSKVIFPTDGDFQKNRYIKISEIVEIIGTLSAKNALLVVDG
jgi:hypothetical protein